MEYTGRRQNGINGRGLKLPQLVSSKGEVKKTAAGTFSPAGAVNSSMHHPVHPLRVLYRNYTGGGEGRENEFTA
jgi:hypothetical protein